GKGENKIVNDQTEANEECKYTLTQMAWWWERCVVVTGVYHHSDCITLFTHNINECDCGEYGRVLKTRSEQLQTIPNPLGQRPPKLDNFFEHDAHPITPDHIRQRRWTQRKVVPLARK